MTKLLYVFGFEAPAQRLANQKHGWDDEDSYAFFIETEDEDDALEWGQEVSEAFCQFLYRESGWNGPIPSWKEDGFAFWIEDDPEEIEGAEGECPTVRLREVPDFATWPDVL